MKPGRPALCSLRSNEVNRQIRCLSPLCLVFISNLALAQPPPGLRPPRGEIGPTFWEQHGWLVIIIAFFVVVAVTAVLILLTRPRRGRMEPPEAVARRSLAALRDRAEDGVLIMEVSRIFRRYVLFAFDLPPEELTTAELNKTLQSLPNAEPALAAAIGDFLRQCDEDKFAPRALPPRMNAVARALELLEKVEGFRQQSTLREPAA